MATATTPWVCRNNWCFPELNPDKFTRVQGMNITFVMSTAQNDESRELLRGFGRAVQAEEAKEGRGRVSCCRMQCAGDAASEVRIWKSLG